MKGIRTKDEPLFSELVNEDDMVPLIEWYVSGLPARAGAIEAAYAALDLPSVRRLALALVESAGSYGFPSITEAARRIEEFARGRCRLDDFVEESAVLIDLCARAQAGLLPWK